VPRTGSARSKPGHTRRTCYDDGCVRAALVVAVFLAAALHAAGTAHADPLEHARAAAQAGEPVVVHVVVPLCDNAQIACGSEALGNPGNLRTNLYWGALYGAKRFFDRPALGYEKLAQGEVEEVLERVVYRRFVPGELWGRDEQVETLTVLDAIHGERIDDAVDRFHHAATHGETLAIADGDSARTLTVHVAGYAGHNRLMDGKELAAIDGDGERHPIPAFVLACRSGAYFSPALREAGSFPLVMTRQLMAPEGYVLEATTRALGDGGAQRATIAAAVKAYAKYQNIGIDVAASVFVPAE
jgi:hypothetical protein